MSDLPEWASDRIETFRVSETGTLDLRPFVAKESTRRGATLDPLTTFPLEITRLQHLQVLLVGGNQIKILPPEICELRQLEVLNVGQNPLSELPVELGLLGYLTTLDLWGCDVRALPAELGNLTRLHVLNLTANPLTELPAWIARFRDLRVLNLGAAGLPYLTELPHWIRTLHKLEELRLRGHALRTLPPWLVHLTRLQVLEVGNNRLSHIPDVVFNLSQLRVLDLSNVDSIQRYDNSGQLVNFNEIREIPPEILRLRNLRYLNVHRSPVETPPMEILQNELNRGVDLDAMRRYFVQLEREGMDYLHEAKLLIVGEPGAGKTTLARKLIDPGYDLSEDESTRGIDIRVWNFDSEGRRFRVNLWDFGGQEIYHATHQFFLTRRSLYILVADSRKEDTDFHYWLNVVELLSGASPAIVLLNEKQDRFRDLNIRELRRQFPSVRHISRANLATDRGYDDLVACIQRQIGSLPHIGTPLPKTWVNVRFALETDDRPWISAQEFEQTCGRHGFTSVEEKRQLGGFLHDLGVVLYFQQDPILRRIVILRPEWGTRAVYQILDDRKVIDAGGRFDDEDLVRVWSDASFRDMRVELLRLMLNFGLCYEVPGARGTYISPQLLPASAPDYDWADEQNLKVKFLYEFLPKGIISQLTVHLHNLIERQSLAWKSGVVFSFDGSRAEVVEHYGQRQIQVRVVGSTKRELLGIISHAMGLIHSTYPLLRVQELIPCSCFSCIASANPEYYPLSVLRQFVHDKQDAIQCRLSYSSVSVRELLAEVSSEAFHSSGIARTSTGGSIEVTGAGELSQPEKGISVNHLEASPSGETRLEPSQRSSGERSRPTNVWVNGSFYLTAVVVVLAAVAMVGNLVAPVVFPIALIAGVLFVSIVGALQLRSDSRLSDKSFVELMRLTLARLPSLRGGKDPAGPSAESDEPTE